MRLTWLTAGADATTATGVPPAVGVAVPVLAVPNGVGVDVATAVQVTVAVGVTAVLVGVGIGVGPPGCNSIASVIAFCDPGPEGAAPSAGTSPADDMNLSP